MSKEETEVIMLKILGATVQNTVDQVPGICAPVVLCGPPPPSIYRGPLDFKALMPSLI